LFFYSLENSRYEPLPDAIKAVLDGRRFIPYKHPDNNAVLIFVKK
jgi:hypothetical protein